MLSLLIVNSDGFGPSAYDTVFHAAELDTVSFEPATSVVEFTNWPTLGSMIDSGKRLVTFLDTGADTTVVPYLLDGTHVSPHKFFILIIVCRVYKHLGVSL